MENMDVNRLLFSIEECPIYLTWNQLNIRIKHEGQTIQKKILIWDIDATLAPVFCENALMGKLTNNAVQKRSIFKDGNSRISSLPRYIWIV